MNGTLIDTLSVTKRTATALNKGSPVKLDTDTDFVVTSTSSGDKAMIGVLAETTVAGGTGRVIMLGIASVKIKTASGLVAGDMIMQSDTAGKAVEVGAVAGTNYPALGKCLVAPGADDELVACFINPCSTSQG